MANVTDTTKVGPAVDTYYDRLLLARAKPFQIHNIAAQRRPLMANEGSTIKFRRYSNMTTATTPLTEGISPAGQSLNVTDITATVDQYGDYVTITDKVTYIVEDRVLNESMDLLGQQMGETVDELTRTVLEGAASVDNCSEGDNGGTPTELSHSDIVRQVKTLMGNSAKMFVPKIPGTNQFGTEPVRAAYWVMAHTDLLDDLEAIDEFTSVANYPKGGAISDSEWGSVNNTRWLLSPLGSKSSDATPVYDCYVVGRDSYGVVELQKGISKSIYHALGHGDDPLEQRSTMGWKTFYVAKILNDNFMTRLRATHS